MESLKPLSTPGATQRKVSQIVQQLLSGRNDGAHRVCLSAEPSRGVLCGPWHELMTIGYGTLSNKLTS